MSQFSLTEKLHRSLGHCSHLNWRPTFFSFSLIVFLSLVYFSSFQSSLLRIERTSNWQTKEWNLASTRKASENSQISWKFLAARFWKDVFVIVGNETRWTTAPELKDGNIKKSTLKLMYFFVTDKTRTRWKMKTINSHRDGWLQVWIDMFFYKSILSKILIDIYQ